MSHKTRDRMSLPPQERLAPPPPPPPEIYKARGRNRANAAQEVWGAGGTVSYMPLRIDYREGEGNFVYYSGYKGILNGKEVDLPAPLFPSKCVAPVETIYALAGPKRMTLNLIRFLSSLHKSGRINRFFEYYNDACSVTLGIHFLQEGYYSAVSKEIQWFIVSLLTQFGVKMEVAKVTGEIIGLMPENDNAYRLRIQDLAGETTKEALIENLPRELERLLKIQATRETVVGGGQDVVERFRSGARILKGLWVIPPIRKRIRHSLSTLDLDKIKLDEADWYHSLLYRDYNAKGKTLEERVKIYAGYYSAINEQGIIDETKLPPRILIKHTGNQW